MGGGGAHGGHAGTTSLWAHSRAHTLEWVTIIWGWLRRWKKSEVVAHFCSARGREERACVWWLWGGVGGACGHRGLTAASRLTEAPGLADGAAPCQQAMAPLGEAKAKGPWVLPARPGRRAGPPCLPADEEEVGEQELPRGALLLGSGSHARQVVAGCQRPLVRRAGSRLSLLLRLLRLLLLLLLQQRRATSRLRRPWLLWLLLRQLARLVRHLCLRLQHLGHALAAGQLWGPSGWRLLLWRPPLDLLLLQPCLLQRLLH